MASDVPLRIAVIGARRSRQGVGAHLARFCARAGAQVTGVLATTSATANEAAALLKRSTGQTAIACTDWGALLAQARPDALVVASPHETHAQFLWSALAEGLHVLCEKPLIWGGSDPAAVGERLAREFLAAGLHLVVNTQWPFTLSAYRQLHPDSPLRSARRFAMRLSPRSRGVDMLIDALPHALSLLAAVAPDPDAEVSDVTVQWTHGGRHAEVAFTYRGGGSVIQADVQLQHCRQQPRPAGYGFDRRFAHRQVDLVTYDLTLESHGRRIPLPDPTPLLVRSFLDAVAAGPPQVTDPGVRPGMRHLAQIVAATPDPAR